MAEERRKPIIFTDFNPGILAVALEPLVKSGEMVVAATIASRFVSQFRKTANEIIDAKPEDMDGANYDRTRRQLLRMGGTALLAAVVMPWLVLPTIAQTTRAVTTVSGRGESLGELLQDVNNYYHPEVDVLTVNLRNAVVAYKQEWWMRRRGDHPEVLGVWGPGHGGRRGLERWILLPMEDKLAYIEAITDLLPKGAGTFSPAFYQIAEFLGQSPYKLYDVPGLKALAG